MVKRVIYPPMWLVFGVCAVFACNEFYPGPRFTSVASQLVGGAILIAGLAMLVVAGGLFKRAGTDLIPFRNVSALVTGGVYRFSRNPMYLGMGAILLGCAVTVGAATALVVPPVFMAIVEWRYIRPEEALLQTLFPQEFSAYCARVRRWL
ncbi:MAG: isoprenylcysteine carboxylmethyltransferase family protein [Haliea sp.]|jgi:protein-S-isoprenylcysteine O-methyltransferase Ste14|nr:isoprenylcysteine carboxylmethyltransferase family protein [Haliea sp.]MDP4916242.1 isoprenylcysteine carboxylmethyltransferase family protein [Haliea sp.]MDP5063601.1 isoprenylcysteine carboxylmethyltransferase family protein [Haliea sp.]